MAFTYAYSLDNGNAPIAQDFGITSAVPAIGDVFIVASNLATTKVISTTANTAKVAASVGPNFRGIGTDATTTSTYQPAALTKLIMDPQAVYRIPWSTTATSAVIGAAYNVANTLVTQDQTLSPSAVNTSYVNFILVDSDTTAYPGAASGYAYVAIPSAYRVIVA